MILAINPGSTSTKVAFFEAKDDGGGLALVQEKKVDHSKDDLAPFKGVIDQFDFRLASLEACFEEADVSLSDLEAVVGRGGLLKPVPSGTFAVNETMLADMRAEARGSHASNLGPLLAHELASRAGVPAFIVDPVSVDELAPVARLSGCKILERECLSHALNTKAVAKRYARDREVAYEDLRLVVVHLGSGISVSAHEGGRMIDVNNSMEEGCFAADRAGSVPCVKLLNLCYAGEYDKATLKKRIFGEGGLASYLGTKSFKEVLARVEKGDAEAALVVDAMVYQIAKDVGAMATVIQGRLDAVLITGGMAFERYLVDRLAGRIEFLGDLVVYPGEDELLALAEGAYRALTGEEKVLDYA